MKSHATMQTRFGRQECAIALLTSLVLSCILVGMALNFAPPMPASWFEQEQDDADARVAQVADVRVTGAEAQEAPPPKTARASASASAPPSDAWNPYHAMLLMAGVTFVTGIVAAGMFVVSLYFLLPRLGVRFEPSIRIEYTGVAPAFAPVAAAGAAAPVSAPAPTTASRFDMGPTLDDLRQAKDAQAERMGEAVLEHLFQDNLNLQAQLSAAG